ncbi:hypothetical protein HV318_03785 [Enterobacter sp. RHBSTW-00901]|uniref:hypothetical protein n=1 Tax=Enterobacter sp. RHBSTW-00901 TaxID=2742669 RepID=UPI0015F57AEE|nr:hypothetical protein [Enterobacter sp. RHBSTW-00901]MBA7854167.1 hypothetical protein [Enterobacter sp. RHBSTW-00901]
MNEQQNNEQIAEPGAVEMLSRASIADVLAQRITVMSTSPKMLEIIDKRVEKFLVDVIDDSFSSWGDFSKGAKEAFKNALPGNIDSVIDLARYNSMIADRLSAVFASSNITNDMVQKAEKALKNAMEEDLLPPVIKLSVLLEAFIDDHAEQAREENWEFPDFRLIDSESVLSTEYKHFYFDKSKEGYSRYSSERSKYSLDNCLDMRAIEGEQIDGDQVFEVYSAKIDDQFVQRIVNTTGLRSKWEKMVFALYYGQSKIVIDCDPDDYGYPGYD